MGPTLEDRREAMRRHLSEVAPWVPFEVCYDPASSAPYRVLILTGDHASKMALRLSALRLHGPDYPVRCDRHTGLAGRVEDVCDMVPVAWALLGHTCGRTP